MREMHFARARKGEIAGGAAKTIAVLGVETAGLLPDPKQSYIRRWRHAAAGRMCGLGLAPPTS